MKQLPFNWKYDLVPGSLVVLLFLVVLIWPSENQHLDPEMLEMQLKPGMSKQECALVLGFDLDDRCKVYGRANEEYCSASEYKRLWNLFEPRHSITLYFEDGKLDSVRVDLLAALLGESWYEFSSYAWE